MAFQKEMWTKDIQENLYAGAEFVQNSLSHDAFVDNAKVHIPQSGTIGSVVKNRTVLPATIAQRADTDRSYDLNEFTTDPIVLHDVEAVQETYDKRMSILKDHLDILNDRIAQEAAYEWCTATAARIIRTTGTATANIAPPSGTGNRNALKLGDIARAAAILDEDVVPQTDRYMLIPSKVYWNFIGENPTVLSSDYAKLTDQDLTMGVVAKVYNIKLILRPSVVVFDNTGTPLKKAIGAVAATTDNFACVVWQMGTVARAMGAIKVYSKIDDPLYYGSIFDAKIMFAAKALRTDGKGLAVIVQA